MNVLQDTKEMDFQDVQRSEKENVNTTLIVLIIEHVFNTNVSTLAIYLTLVVSKQSVRQHLIDLFVDVHQDGEEILTNNVTNMNAEKTLIVHLIRHASLKNVLIHVKESHVAEEPNAKLNNIEEFVIVQEDYKEILLSLVKKLAAHRMTTVQEMRNVTSYLVEVPEKNVNHSVSEGFALKEQAVRQQITKKYVPAIIRYKETDMLPVMNVSMSSHDSYFAYQTYLLFRICYRL